MTDDELPAAEPPEDRRVYLRRAEDLQLLHYRTRTSEVAIKEVQGSIAVIEKALVALVSYEGRIQNVTMELHHVMTYQDLLKNLHLQHDKWAAEMQERVRGIELQMPLLLAVRGWIVSAGLGVLALVGTALVVLVLR